MTTTLVFVHVELASCTKWNTCGVSPEVLWIKWLSEAANLVMFNLMCRYVPLCVYCVLPWRSNRGWHQSDGH